jgi:predicted aspartyl protease
LHNRRKRLRRSFAAVLALVLVFLLPLLLYVQKRTAPDERTLVTVQLLPYATNPTDAFTVWAKVNGKRKRLVVDTGAGSTVLRSEKASDQYRHSDQYAQATIAIGPFVRTRNCRIYSQREARRVFYDLPGLLGCDVFEKDAVNDTEARVTFDFRGRRLTIDLRKDRQTYTPAEGAYALRMITDGSGQYWVSEYPGGFSAEHFMIDTGAYDDVLVPRRVYDDLSRTRGPDGKEIRWCDVRLDALHPPVRCKASVHPILPDKFLLGLGFLTRYKMTMDFRDMMLYLEPLK